MGFAYWKLSLKTKISLFWQPSTKGLTRYQKILWECSFRCKSLLNFNDLATKLENYILRYLTFIHRQYSIYEVNYQVVVSSHPTWIVSISIIVISIEYWHCAIVRPGCAYCKDGVECCQLGCETGKVICDRDCNYWDSSDNTDLIKTDPLSMLF